MKHTFPTLFRLGIGILCLMGLRRSAFAELLLVEAGISHAPIVVFADAPPMTRRAADALADFIEKISDARPEVIVGMPEPLPESAIWVGDQPVLETLFPDLDLDFQHPEEILIAANARHLVIAGRDRWHPDHLRVEGDSYKGRNAGLDGVQQEYGTANAVYTFLQDSLDVRWLWPGDLGTDILRRDRIAFAPFVYRHHPQIRGRSRIFTFSSLFSWRGHSHEWLRFQRGQLDSLEVIGGHPFSGWWERFGETHPEFFALQPDGSRTWSSGRTIKLCKSNPAVWEQWLKDVEATLERNPNQRVFGANANDGGYSGYCICDDCIAWDHPDGQPVRHMWQGIAQNYVAMSDRQVTFANTLARLLRERFPDRDLYVAGMAYGNSRPAPVEAVPDDNVIFSVVANFHNRPGVHTIWVGGDHREDLRAWAKVAPNIAWRPNLGGDAGWREGMPNIAPHRVIQDFRFAAENNVVGIFFDMVWEHWANHAPHYYLLAQMAWNPAADGEAILADYYQRAFGPAVGPMTAYWTLLDKASDDIVFNRTPLAETWDGAFYARAYGYLDEADATLEDAAQRYRDRIDFVRAGLDYMRLFYENRVLISQLRDPDGQLQVANEADAEALARARANWQQILQIFADHPVAFNALYVGPGRGRAEAANPDTR